ncbi:protein FAR1-RELATED SEQUENCE 5-like [Humulus lupulus]|uniref:protein FAR1-RELATED SEQUENCE 5-like n=1 Tax=Humulus lupulus TaxID=3486 RepID=UPI002B400886|nr:protein FAR1-RELATED SEQUENCE 5-like [Humulus lupulus]
MIHNFQFKTKRSEPREYLVTCVDDNCNWLLRASKFRKTETFKVRKYVKTHTCSLDIIMEDHRQANCNVIGELIKSKYMSIKRVHTPHDMINDMLDDFGVSMGYQKAWRAREKALELARGNQDDSYQKLPIYLHMLKVSNPGTITHLVTDNTDHFKYMYLAFANSIKGWKHCRPVIVIDGTYLKTSFGGTLFTASTMDANNNIFPLAFGIGDSENDSSWLWFFTKLKETYGEREGMAIISDRHKSIENAIDHVYPKAFHGACIFHLLNNIKVNFGVHGEDLNLNFVKAAKAYRVQSFEHYMHEIDKIDTRIRPYLQKIGYSTWSRCHAPTRRYTMMTLIIAESINAALKAARTLPITTMMEGLRSLVQKWVWKNGNEANGTFTQVTTDTETVLRENFIRAIKFQVFPVNTILYQVVVEQKGNFLVNLMEKTCECKRFQQDEIPCAHAIAVFAKTRLKTYDYVADYYKTTTMKATYDSIVHPLPNEGEWTLPETLNIIVLPPKSRKPPGRPRRKRIRSRGEPKVQIKCGRCAQQGHNRKTCRNEPIPKLRNTTKSKKIDK